MLSVPVPSSPQGQRGTNEEVSETHRSKDGLKVEKKRRHLREQPRANRGGDACNAKRHLEGNIIAALI